jgi:hypothetical protein
VPRADLEVVEIVRRRDLHAAGAENRIDVGVGDHRYPAVGERQRDVRADEVLVSLVVRMDRDRDVAEHRLGTRRRDDEMPFAIGERIADVPELTVLLVRLDLEVRHRGLEHRVPVDEAFSAVDEALLVQAHEDFGDGV